MDEEAVGRIILPKRKECDVVSNPNGIKILSQIPHKIRR